MKLIFVYNSDGNFSSLIKDTAHKLVSPKTHPCNLCRITYPFATMDEQWKKFIKSLPHQVAFLHRDEFRKQYPNQKDVQLPAVFTPLEAGFPAACRGDECKKVPNARVINARRELLTGFTEKATGPEILIAYTEINKANSVESLIETVKRFLPKPR